jgi:hypothetical protein
MASATAVPEEFLCPITLSLMTDPVIGSDGRTYERSAIQQWLRTNPHSPLTREPMNVSSLKTNYALKSAIERFNAQAKPKADTGAPKSLPKKKAPPPTRPQPTRPQLIPAPPPVAAVAAPSAPPADDVYYAIEVYQEELARNATRPTAPVTQTNANVPVGEVERRKKVLMFAFGLLFIVILIVAFEKILS